MTDASLDDTPSPMAGTPPPPELVVVAFRKAAGTGKGQGPRPEPSRRTTQNDGLLSAPIEEEPGFREDGDAGATRAWIEETLDAFRAAGGEVWNGSADEQTQREGSARPVSEESPADAIGTSPVSSESGKKPVEGPDSGGEMRTETHQSDGKTDVSDDLAQAFRRAFYERRVRHQMPSRTGSGKKPTRTVSFPSRPASSFLWVTGPSEGSTISVGIPNLSGLRARRAGAFLLRGDGKKPYRLLRRIRHHSAPRIFLKPVFWRAGPDGESPVADHVDGTWTPQANKKALQKLRARAATINRRIRDVVEGDEATTGTDAERRLLLFIATRTDAFSRRRVGGSVVYPRLTPLLGGTGREKN